MKEDKFQGKVINATKWSTITEIAAKIVSPVTNMILARILAPEAFGVVATVTMIVSFAEMFADSGFQKYLIQHNFKDDDEKYNNANVAFWTNFGVSILLWCIIALFRDQLAILVGSPSLGKVIAIACLQLPLTAFSSIQMALYRRDFDFKTLFIARMIAVSIPFFVTIPLALLGFNYWALIIGTLTIQIFNAIILTIKSKWKPKFYYSLNILKEMLYFSIWSLIEAISIWLTTWVDTFIIGSVLNKHYLGIYKTSTSMVNTLMALITSSIVPVLFSTLSRLQEDEKQFRYTFLKFQRLVSILVFPLGIGVYLYSDLATQILLGGQWNQASRVIGLWALTSSIQIVLSHFCSEVYRAKGRPKLSFIAQILHLVVLVPVCIISSNYGFWVFVHARSWIRLEGVLIKNLIMKFVLKFPIIEMAKNVMPTAISAIIMGVLGYFLKQIYNGIVWDIISIISCILFYFVILSLFPTMRKEMITIIKKVIPRSYMSRYKTLYKKPTNNTN